MRYCCPRPIPKREGEDKMGSGASLKAITAPNGDLIRLKGLGPPVGDLDPTTKVANTHRGLRKPQKWGRGFRLVTLAPKSTGISSSRSRSIRG
ncbi:hypothetical protein CRG98_019038 [Punica granatum]|uniref:Uncharacterized protein n=1 Tax=Punica granatum TaxID=22663 RepID=A0A2I0JWD3_PUNGR|nr:hypothetical protein CRG98_019038 [Punica granatum]